MTPSDRADPEDDKSWTFPDTVEGIHSALERGANTLWANTVLHSTHPLVTMRSELAKSGIRMVGQSPALTERWDDKARTNRWLSEQTGLEGAFPKARILHKGQNDVSVNSAEDELGWPRVMKPIRGRGSHGVAVVKDEEEFMRHLDLLYGESDAVLVEVSRSGR